MFSLFSGPQHLLWARGPPSFARLKFALHAERFTPLSILRQPFKHDDPRIRALAQEVMVAMGGHPNDAVAGNPVSPWRPYVVRHICLAAGDPDMEIWSWLRVGAPLGITLPIKPGGLLPLAATTASLDPGDLLEEEPWHGNHGSFEREWPTEDGATDRPAQALLEELIDLGFLELYEDQQEAEEFMGKGLVPSPLGDVTKVKPDGSVKHRLITDLKASLVNACIEYMERQVLPRFFNHARDMALASLEGESWTLILNFCHAFMTIPLSRAEQRWMCSSTTTPVRRT